jgi:hypothetical protein
LGGHYPHHAGEGKGAEILILVLKDASLQPEKSYTTQGDPVWVCKGFALEIDEAELRRYHPHLKAINIIK